MEVTLKDLKEILGAPTSSGERSEASPYVLNKSYLIRTVTMIYTGSLVSVFDKELVIKDAAWIADTGRFHEALKDPSVLKEIEPYPNGPVIIGRGAILDVAEWSHDLPRVTK